MQKRLLLILVVVSCAFNLRAGDRPIGSWSGTYLVGSSQTYKKLTDVAAVLNNSGNTITGNVVFELDSDYDGTTGEAFPITFNQFNVSGGNWTVTIRPKAGVSIRTTSGNPGASALITLNGTDRIIFDGRAGGTGNIAWLIRNAAATNANATILLQNDAQSNTLTYLQLEGQTTSVGVVQIGTSGTEGNDNNTISYCRIRDRSDAPSPTRPATGILSQGSAASSENTFDHNNIFNFYNSGGSAYGIRLAQGAMGASITYNSIYQEQALLNAAAGTTLYGISAGEQSASRLTIANNFIGGSAPQCGGGPLTIASALGTYCIIKGISFGAWIQGAYEQNVCDHNTIRNITMTSGGLSYNLPNAFTGIYVLSNMDVTKNIIGNPAGHDDIKITIGSETSHFKVYLIDFRPNYSGFITGNRMGGVTLAGKASEGVLTGIYGDVAGGFIPPGPVVLSDNVIGSPTIPDNIRVVSDTLPVSFSGIDFYTNHPLNCINNTVAGIVLGYAGTTVRAPFAGIDVTVGGALLFKNNLVSDISSASLATFSPESEASVLNGFRGIYAHSNNMEISGNTVRRLRLTGTRMYSDAGANTSIIGIYLMGSTACTVYNNKVYGLSSANDLGPTAATMLSGIRIEQFSGNATFYNNLIALDNGGLSNNCEINGLRMKALYGAPANKLYHNTIYIGGSSSNSSDAAASAPIAYSGAVTGNAFFSIRNNLLVNGRTGGTGGHYLLRNMSPAHNWTTASSDTNMLVTATISRIGQWGAADLDSTQWKTKGDAHSWFYTTLQVPPATLFTDAATGDLSIKTGAQGYVMAKGAASTGIRTDYTGGRRSARTPTIGAYEYGFVNTAPVITSHGGNAAITLQMPENKIVVTSVTATDTDAGMLTYSLAGGEDEGKFTINNSTGVLSFITAPDYEQPGDANGDNAYIVAVQVSDGDSTATQRFKIKITDANDHAPVITSYNGDAGVTLQVPENTTTVIATVTATDVDKNTTITYSLVNEEDATQFGVNPSTGELSFITPPPDFEQPRDNNQDNIYVVTVKASDGDSSVTQRFKIKLTNVNDNTPIFTSHNGDEVVNIQVAENTITVDTVSATDGDHATVVYSIVNGDDGALFSISAAGVLSFIMAPDFDAPADANADNQYIVSVKVSDGTLFTVQQFIITVTDLADNPPVATMTIRVPEHTVEVTPLEGSDADAGTSVVFTMVNQEDGALFWLNPVNGALEFKTAPDFDSPTDADHDNTYLVAVKMTAGDQVTILRFQVKVTAADAGTGRTTGRNTSAPQVQSTVVLQMETAPGTKPGNGIRVYPNPVTGKRFTLRMDSITAGLYTLELYSTTGQLVCKQQLNHTGKSVIYPIQLPFNLIQGSYLLKLTGGSTKYTEKLIIE